ncbi:leucine-rich repeat domain-containing protein [bacterium SCSIO 12741]|nr:leucine-rich repeat domain-containing protein [bacterium SCSIO 12741]
MQFKFPQIIREKYLVLPILFLFINVMALAQQYTKYPMDVQRVVFTDLNEALKDPERVFRLKLSGQKMGEVPESLLVFKNLQMLWLDSVGLKEFDLEKGTFKNLLFLSLMGNQLTDLKIPPGCMSDLNQLYLDDNQLTEFPDVANPFIAITTLSIRQNKITQIPAPCEEWKHLRFLYLDYNPLKNANQAFALSSDFERLSFYQTGLRTLKCSQAQRKLVKLVISDNLIDFKDWNPDDFPRLAYLDVSYHPNLGPEFWNKAVELPRLKFLVVESAGIQEIPSSIGALKGLREISLLGNEINHLPQEFYALDLRLINLEYNPLASRDKEQLSQVFGKNVYY